MKKGKRSSEMAGIVLKALFISILTMWCFFDFSLCSLPVLLLIPFEIRRKLMLKKKETAWVLTLAFRDALMYFRNALLAGYSPENAMKEVLRGLEQMYQKDHAICLEFQKMLSKMELGSSMEEVWLWFGERSDAEDIRQFAEVLSVVKRTGGDLSLVLRQSGDIIQEKIELKRELRMAIASKEAEFRLMSMFPHGILLYLKWFAPSLSEGLYHNGFGIVFMWSVFLLSVGLNRLGQHIIRREIAG